MRCVAVRHDGTCPPDPVAVRHDNERPPPAPVGGGQGGAAASRGALVRLPLPGQRQVVRCSKGKIVRRMKKMEGQRYLLVLFPFLY